MHRLRWLLLAAILLAIAAVIAYVAITYAKRKEMLTREEVPAPAPLETGVEGKARDWEYTQSDGDQPKVSVRAKSFKQIREPSLVELDGVELKIYHQDAREFDLVKSEKVQFDIAAKSLYSEGDVEISLGVHGDSPVQGRLLKIHTSGAKFASDTGKAETDRPASFEFENGGGSSTGAEYDPNTRELHLKHQVSLDWKGGGPDAIPMHAEAGEAIYKEHESRVYLFPWSKLTRQTLRMEAGSSAVVLEKGEIRRAELQAAHGLQDEPGRRIEFASDQMVLSFGERMVVQRIEGERNARLVSTQRTAMTTVTTDRLELEFTPLAKAQAALSVATAKGHSVAEAVPLARAGNDLPDTRILRSDTIFLRMRPGGEEIDNAETAGAGTLDFVPNRANQPKRSLKGDKIWVAYGNDNRIESFRSVNVTTRTDKPALDGKPAPPALTTSSKEILATFDPATSELTRMEQKTDFRYEEGTRQAKSDRALLDQRTDSIVLEGAARVWDPTGSANADRIDLNQKSGDFTAQGRVATTRQPDKKGNSSAMLSNEDVLQARAQRMVATDNNQHIRYEGSAVAWQGANRVEADRLEIDRKQQIMEAHGKVVSQFVDKPKPGITAAKAAAPVFTVVRAPDMTYSDGTRVAHYQGGVNLTRPGMTVSSKELRAFLKEANSDSSLDKALADGAVKIVSSDTSGGSKRTRTATSEHAEYYAGEERVVLQGGRPLLVDSVKGRTSGEQLTWFANNDRLLVNGEEKKPAESTILNTRK